MFTKSTLQQRVEPKNVLADKEIAKISSIIQYYRDTNNENVKEKDIYLGNEYMISDESEMTELENKCLSFEYVDITEYTRCPIP